MSNILDEGFEPDEMIPAELEATIIEAYEEYGELPSYSKIKKEFRNAYNKCCDSLQDKRGFKQFASL